MTIFRPWIAGVTTRPWLKENFGWSRQTADRYIHVAETFGKMPSLSNLSDVNITGEALYLLSGNGVSGKMPTVGNLEGVNIEARATCSRATASAAIIIPRCQELA